MLLKLYTALISDIVHMKAIFKRGGEEYRRAMNSFLNLIHSILKNLANLFCTKACSMFNHCKRRGYQDFGRYVTEKKDNCTKQMG